MGRAQTIAHRERTLSKLDRGIPVDTTMVWRTYCHTLEIRYWAQSKRETLDCRTQGYGQYRLDCMLQDFDLELARLRGELGIQTRGDVELCQRRKAIQRARCMSATTSPLPYLGSSDTPQDVKPSPGATHTRSFCARFLGSC